MTNPIVIYDVARMRHAIEANGPTHYGKDLTATLNAFKDCPFLEGSVTLTLKEMTESPKHAVQHLDDHNIEVLLSRAARLEFEINIATLDARCAAAVTAPQSPLGQLLRVTMGGEQLGTGTAVTTGATTRAVPVTDASGIAVGSMVWFATGAGGTFEGREVASKDGTGNNTLHLKFPLSAAPADSSVAYSGATYYLHGTDGGETESLQTIFERQGGDDRFILLGGYLADAMGVQFVTPGKIGKLKFAFEYASFLYQAEAAGAGSLTGALGFATYANCVPLVQADSQFRMQTVGDTTFADANIIRAPVIKFDPKWKYTRHIAPDGVNNVVQPLRDRVDPAMEGSFVVPRTSQAYYDLKAASTTKKDFTYQIGSSPTRGAVAFVAPTCQVIDVQPAAQDRISSVDVKWRPRLDAGTTEGTKTNLGMSVARIHLG